MCLQLCDSFCDLMMACMLPCRAHDSRSTVSRRESKQAHLHLHTTPNHTPHTGTATSAQSTEREESETHSVSRSTQSVDRKWHVHITPNQTASHHTTHHTTQVQPPQPKAQNEKRVKHAPLVEAHRALTGSGTLKGHYSLEVGVGGLSEGEGVRHW